MARTPSRSSFQVQSDQAPHSDEAQQQQQQQQQQEAPSADATAAGDPQDAALAPHPWALSCLQIEQALATVSGAPIAAESLSAVQAAREAALRLLAGIDQRLNEAKRLVAQRAEALEIVEPRPFSVPSFGNVLLGRGQRVLRAKQPAHFAAIVAQLTHGAHFLFV